MVSSRHGIMDNGDPCPVRGLYGSSPWKGIMRFFSEFKEGLVLEVGNGRKTKFWEEKW